MDVKFLSNIFAIETLLFLIGMAVIIFTVLIIKSKNMIFSILLLSLLFFHIGGALLLTNTQFIGLMLILIYAGGLVILFLFVLVFLDIPVHQGLFFEVLTYSPFFLGAAFISMIEVVLVDSEHFLPILTKIQTPEYFLNYSLIENLSIPENMRATGTIHEIINDPRVKGEYYNYGNFMTVEDINVLDSFTEGQKKSELPIVVGDKDNLYSLNWVKHGLCENSIDELYVLKSFTSEGPYIIESKRITPSDRIEFLLTLDQIEFNRRFGPNDQD